MRNAVELAFFVALLAFLVWVPMPFGSASDASQPALILPPLLICCAAALLRASRKAALLLTRPGRIWTVGGVLFVLRIALQFLPMALYVSAYVWHTAAPAGATFGRRFVKLVERRFFPFAFGILAALGCATAVLMSESRGALLALIGGFAIVGAMASDRKNAVLRGILIAVGLSAAIVATLLVLRLPGTVARSETSQTSQVEARRDSIVAGFRIWQMFPLFGSGAGTYPDVVLMTRATSGDTLANHAHDDYAEILGTTGSLGFVEIGRAHV